MREFLDRLDAKAQRGSKPRCHWLTHGSREHVIARLNDLAAPWASVSVADRWMPEGFEACEEAQLHTAARLLDADTRRALAEWWLPKGRHDARTPNFDIASTCRLEDRPGLLLVEAKAHDEELKKETAGRPLPEGSSSGRKASHTTIGNAISAAQAGLTAATKRPWHISRDRCYQMSNRFAWSWKLAELGIPVVLVYLGFLRANEMTDRGEPFVDHTAWESLVRIHSASLFPNEVWDQCWWVNGTPFVPLIKTLERPFDMAAA